MSCPPTQSRCGMKPGGRRLLSRSSAPPRATLGLEDRSGHEATRREHGVLQRRLSPSHQDIQSVSMILPVVARKKSLRRWEGGGVVNELKYENPAREDPKDIILNISDSPPAQGGSLTAMEPCNQVVASMGGQVGVVHGRLEGVNRMRNSKESRAG
ncbi:hypothetical protein RRG08_035022 [Elysia crispata]|uniref:Uncharacterized protein n=1 Tax=Elysia crispata TaxID=231223 RepID=A0AAE0ZSK3_9GAST|nr:hypothetical protein RRG08_035022 [Elysia crispata]